ncbi:MAG: methionyl-tRNA formyltransferase [Bacteroidia bacterium]|nr:methionyl-tRNA formyltransferase [Bacteroidia bacterium]
MRIQILVDNIKSYIIPYAKELNEYFLSLKYESCLIHNSQEVVEGDILFLLSCQNIFKDLHLNKHNIVVHASDLPKGRGWSPLTWQILEGKNEIVVSLFEAVLQVDAGDIYLQDKLVFEGHELLPELQAKLGQTIVKLIKAFVEKYPNIQGKKQIGKPTYYPKRTPKDSELDINKTINEQFNLLRVCDNEQYPAFFVKDGIKYILKIEKSQ